MQEQYQPKSSQLFEPYKTIGLVTNYISPVFSYGQLIEEGYVYTSIGNTYHVYNLKSLVHVTVGPQLPSSIAGLYVERISSKDDILYIQCENNYIYIFHGLSRELITILEPTLKQETTGKFIQFLKIGQYLLSCYEKVITIYDTLPSIEEEVDDIYSHYSFIDNIYLPNDSNLTCATHLPTYLDKILIGTKEGHLLLFNFRVGKEIFRFTKHLENNEQENDNDKTLNLLQTILENNLKEEGKKNSVSVTCVRNAPAIDVVGVGLSDGRILMLNLKYNVILLDFKQIGSVTTLSFRTTSTIVNNNEMSDVMESHLKSNSEDLLSSGNHNGDIFIWDLLNAELVTKISDSNSALNDNDENRYRHKSKITCCEFLPGEPVICCGSDDNILSLHIFDRNDKVRLITFRSGHAKPPKFIKFYDPIGNFIVTGGLDGKINVINIHDPKQFHSLNTNKNNRLWKKQSVTMPPIKDMDVNYIRQDDYSNLICCHNNINTVTCWNVKYLRAEKENIYIKELKFGQPNCTCFSTCGNFIFIGTTKGYLQKFSTQSLKLHFNYTTNTKEEIRKANVEIHYENTFSGKTIKKKTINKILEPVAHDGSIHSILVDNTNNKLISAGTDGIIKVWKTNTINDDDKIKESLLASFEMKMPIIKMIKTKNSATNLIAICLENFNIYIIDLNTLKIIRYFNLGTSPILDMCFTNDSHYFLVSQSDGSVKTFDLLSTKLVDWFIVPNPVTSMDFHPEGLYLITSHIGSVGIGIWANKIIFSKVLLQCINSPVIFNLLPFSGEELLITNRSIINKSLENVLKQRKEDELNRKKRVKQLMSDNEEHSDSSDNEEEMVDGKKMKESIKGEKNVSQQQSEQQEPSNFIKLSGLPKWKWQSITHLDELRQRNKISQQKQQELDTSNIAPFFLPSKASSKDIDFDKSLKPELQQSRIMKWNNNENTLSTVNPLLFKIQKEGYESAMNWLKNSSIKEIDISIRTIHGYNEYLLILKMFYYFLNDKVIDYDLVQASLHLFLQVHSEVLANIMSTSDNDIYSEKEVQELKDLMINIMNANRQVNEPLEDLISYNSCMIDYFAYGGIWM
ncbi:hypothetical protein ABK040_006826 [Willaertia magna]